MIEKSIIDVTVPGDEDSDSLLAWDIELMMSLYENLEDIAHNGFFFVNDHTVISDLAIKQECHAAAAALWMIRPESYDLCTGIADGYCAHSWLRHKETGVIHEPTPILRDAYYGVVMKDPYSSVKSDHARICRLIDAGEIDSCVGQLFKDAYNQHFSK